MKYTRFVSDEADQDHPLFGAVAVKGTRIRDRNVAVRDLYHQKEIVLEVVRHAVDPDRVLGLVRQPISGRKAKYGVGAQKGSQKRKRRLGGTKRQELAIKVVVGQLVLPPPGIQERSAEDLLK